MIPIAKPLLDENEIKAVTAVLRSGSLAQGAKVEDFEREFAEYLGVRHAIAVCNGTAALHLAMLAHGIGKGDEVITTPFTFIASANSILFTDARPVFADIDPDTYNIDPVQIKKRLTKKTKAILPVHLYGQTADMDAITEIARERDLIIIEDACQAHGASYNGKKAGNFSTATFSFYPTKNITTGEGGMITAADEEIADKLRLLRNHGSRTRYLHEILGYNLRMTDISAAIGIEQLKKLDKFNKKRRENAMSMTKKLSRVKGIITPKIAKKCIHVFHQYTIRVTDEFGIKRDEVARKLGEKGIGTGIYYPAPVHMQPVYKKLGYNAALPNSEMAAREVLSLPIHPAIGDKEIEYIATAIKELAE